METNYKQQELVEFSINFRQLFNNWKCQKKGRNQQTFADMIGTSRQTISAWLNGDYVPTRNIYIINICRVLDITPSDLFPTIDESLKKVTKLEEALNVLGEIRRRIWACQDQLRKNDKMLQDAENKIIALMDCPEYIEFIKKRGKQLEREEEDGIKH